MNFFDFNIGDYDEATSHLSSREDGLYGRMIRKYYAKEEPLPLDVAKIQRLVRCADEEDRQAVVVLLQEFFEKREDGYHKEPIDRRIEAYRAGQPLRDQKKQNEADRATRYNLERSRLFEAVRGAGKNLRWDTPMPALRAAAAEILAPQTPSVIGKPQTPQTDLKRTQNATSNGSHTAKPRTSNQEPVIDVPEGSVTPPAPKLKKLKEPSASTSTWDAYSAAYLARYKAEPVRNASVNGQLAQVVAKLGAEAAPQVAAYYLRHKGNLYTAAMHPVNLLLRDAEKLHTEWKTKAADTPANGTSYMREREAQAAGWMGSAAPRRVADDPDTIDMET
jgi:uncharacterized protein YdaU (DUF1376 family)